MIRPVDRDRSLEALEGIRWPTPPADATRLVRTACALRGKPLSELTVEDLRLLIRQDIGLSHLLPLALEVLRDTPLAEGDMYEGDLLSAVLTRRPAVWQEHPELWQSLGRLVTELAELPDLPPIVRQDVERFLALPTPHEQAP